MTRTHTHTHTLPPTRKVSKSVEPDEFQDHSETDTTVYSVCPVSMSNNMKNRAGDLAFSFIQ